MSGHDTPDAASRVTRRGFVRGGAAGLAAASVPALATTGDAQTETPAEGQTYENAAVRSSATTFGKGNYQGLFVQIEGTNSEARREGVNDCAFVGPNEAVAAFDAYLINRLADNSASERVVVFASAEDTTLGAGKLYVVNQEEPCQSDYVSLQLESIGASEIRVDPATQTTEGAMPGFGPLAAVAGIGGAALAALARARREE